MRWDILPDVAEFMGYGGERVECAPVTVAVISGVFSLIGACAGAFAATLWSTNK